MRLRPPTAAWTKAPVRLLRLPTLGAAVASGAAVLALATASAPLFLASAGNAAVTLSLEGVTPEAGGLSVETAGVPDRRTFQPADAALRAATAGVGRLAEPTLFGLASVFGASANGEQVRARMLTRDGFGEHIEVIDSAPGARGVWLPDSVAEQLRLEPGDTVTVGFGEEEAQAPVAGIYVDLRSARLTEYWQPLGSLFTTRDTEGLEPPPPPMLLADLDAFLSAGRTLPPASFRWQALLEFADLTLPQLRAARARLDRIGTDIANPSTELGQPFDDLSAYGPPETRSVLAAVVGEVDETAAVLRGPVSLLSLAGRAVAIVVVAAAAAFAAQRRRIEHQVLTAAGETPLATGARAGVEALLPVLLGAAAGLAMAVWLVDLLGPGASGDAAVRVGAVRAVIRNAALAVVVFAVVTPVAARRAQASAAAAPGRRLAARLPWEAVLLALAAASYYEVVAGSDVAVELGAPPRIDALVLAFPLLFIAGCAGLAGRAMRRVLPRLRRAGDGWRPSLYLAARQLAGASRAALLLVVASSLAVGVGVYAATLVATSQRTVQAKAQIVVGSDVSAEVRPGAIPTAVGRFPTTLAQFQRATLDGRVEVNILGVDPDTLPAAVNWDDRFADRPLPELLATLRADSGRLPVLAVGGGIPDQPTLRDAEYGVPLQVVARPQAFPGASERRPLLVVDARRYVEAVDAASQSSIGAALLFEPQTWLRGDPGDIVAALEADGFGVTDENSVALSGFTLSNPPQILTAQQVAGGPGLAGLGWTFRYLQALGLAAALLAIIGLLLYLQARQAEREVSYALSSRMGLSRGANRTAVAVEVAGMLAAALTSGTLLALAAAWLINTRLDPLPQVPPAPLFTVPASLLLAVVAALPVLAWCGAMLVQRAADRTNVADVLRLAAG